MEYFIIGKISFEIDIDGIEAESIEEAEKKAVEMCKDYYHLDVVNGYHNSKNIHIDLSANEYDDE